MAKQEKKLLFSFVNPNNARSFEQVFRRILIERIVALHRQNAAATG